MRSFIAAIVIIVMSSSALCEAQDGPDYARERQLMVDSQVMARGIKDQKILGVIGRIERHKFLPEGMKQYAYEDVSLPIGDDEAVPPAYFVALVAQLAELKGDEKVLEVGVEAGYQAAVLAELTREVYCVEPSEALALQAEGRFKALGYKNIKIKTGSVEDGWLEHAPFDVIVITNQMDHAPRMVVEQVAINGKLIMPLREYWGKKLIVMTKTPKGKEGYEMTATLVGPVIGEKPIDFPKEEKDKGENKKWSPSQAGKWMNRKK